MRNAIFIIICAIVISRNFANIISNECKEFDSNDDLNLIILKTV